MDSALKQLIAFSSWYSQLLDKWETVPDRLRFLSKQVSAIPEPEYLESERKVLIEWGDIPVFCKFSAAGDMGILIFGYVERRSDGKCLDIETGRLFFDKLGNVRESIDAHSSRCILSERSDYDDFFFPKMLDAVEKAIESRAQTDG